MPATPRVVDLTLDKQGRPKHMQGGRPARVMTPKQIRARARRHQRIADAELNMLYKPLDQWDNEELARGRPRDKGGGFRGKAPDYIDRAIHEQIVRRFEVVVRSEMNAHTVEALKVIQKILTDEDTDDRGRPTTSPATKLQAAQFLIEHVIGKPKQRVETDITVKMQQMLGSVMVMPTPDALDFDPNPALQLTQGYIDAEVVEDGDEDESDGE